jgi:hypothetical protein
MILRSVPVPGNWPLTCANWWAILGLNQVGRGNRVQGLGARASRQTCARLAGRGGRGDQQDQGEGKSDCQGGGCGEPFGYCSVRQVPVVITGPCPHPVRNPCNGTPDLRKDVKIR